jgi:hypothetical protein
MTDSEFDELKKRTVLRQRRKTNLVEYETAIKKLMDLDVSLPVILEWLVQEKKIATTLPALRRFVIRTFSDGFYDEFTVRNGWQKNKSKRVSHISQANESKQKSKLEKFVSKGGVTQEELKESLRQKVDLNCLDE